MSNEVFEALKKGFEQAAKSGGKKGDNPFGSLEIHQGGDTNIESHVPYGTPTGIPELDLRIRGGYPAGKVIELYGFQYCGKTSAGLHAVAENQKKGGYTLWVDTERAWDDDRARDLGINLENVSVVTADTVEAVISSIDIALDQLQSLENPPRFLVVVDSITGVPTEKEMQTHLTNEARVGHEAKQIRRGLKGLMGKIADTKATVIFINHAVAKIGVMFGKQSQAAGGHALKFFATVRISFASKGTIKDAEKNRIGQVIVLECDKLRAKLSSPKIESVNLLDEKGFDAVTSLLNAAIETEMVTKKNQRTYCLGEDIEFALSDWPEIISHNGGYNTVYKAWRQDAQKKGILLPWGVSKYSVVEEEKEGE